jgi:hypothetical protein
MTERRLQAALEALWAPWPATPFPPDAKFPLSGDLVGSALSPLFQADGSAVPPFPPSHPENRPAKARGEAWDAATLTEWGERAAILEHDGGLSRVDAEAQARAEIDAGGSS